MFVSLRYDHSEKHHRAGFEHNSASSESISKSNPSNNWFLFGLISTAVHWFKEFLKTSLQHKRILYENVSIAYKLVSGPDSLGKGKLNANQSYGCILAFCCILECWGLQNFEHLYCPIPKSWGMRVETTDAAQENVFLFLAAFVNVNLEPIVLRF